jgi:hypothetical protein
MADTFKGTQGSFVASGKVVKQSDLRASLAFCNAGSYGSAYGNCYISKEEAEANAVLFAAAPDLLAAAEAAQQCIADLLEVYGNGGSMAALDLAVKSLRADAGKRVSSAIAKAITPPPSSRGDQ